MSAVTVCINHLTLGLLEQMVICNDGHTNMKAVCADEVVYVYSDCYVASLTFTELILHVWHTNLSHNFDRIQTQKVF